MVDDVPGADEASGRASNDAPVAGRRPVLGPLPYDMGVIVADPGGPVTLTSFTVPDSDGVNGVSTFILDPRTGTFTQTTYTEAKLSPDGRTVAGIEPDPPNRAHHLVVRDRRTGRERRIPLSSEPLSLQWSPRGRQILHTSLAESGSVASGFVITDADTLRSDFGPVTLRSRPVAGVASWDANADQVLFVTQSPEGSRLHRVSRRGGDLGEGVLLRPTTADGVVRFSPSGRMLAATCLTGREAAGICLWDATGPPDRAPRLLRRLHGLQFRAWYDDDHLLAARLDNGDPDLEEADLETKWETVLIDLEGRNPQVIVRDTSWAPGAGVFGDFSPVPPPRP